MTPFGDYTVTNLPAGVFYAYFNGWSFSQLYQGIDCNPNTTCDPTTGTAIVLAQGENAEGIDFDPMPINYVFGRVTNGTGQPLAGVAVDLWNGATEDHCGVAVTNADGYYAVTDSIAICANTHRLSTDVNPASYENQVYDGVLCPAGSVYLGLCSLDAATQVANPATPAFVIANFVLQPRSDALFENGFDP